MLYTSTLPELYVLAELVAGMIHKFPTKLFVTSLYHCIVDPPALFVPCQTAVSSQVPGLSTIILLTTAISVTSVLITGESSRFILREESHPPNEL